MNNVNFDTLKSAVKGALRIYEQENKLFLRRFTLDQEQFFNQTVNYVNKPLKSKASTSMVIDFVSNTESLQFSAQTFVASTRTLCFFDVYCDDELIAHCGYNIKEDGEVIVTANFKSGKKRIRIYLPNLFETRIKSFCIDDGAMFIPYKSPIKWLFLGDSITQGYVAEYSSNTYANQVARAFDAQVVSWAIGGAYFLADDLADQIDFVPDVISVAYGTNDWAHGYDIEKNATEYFTKLKKVFPKAKVVCITPIWRGDIERRQANATMPFEKVGDLIKNICQKFNISVIDGSKLVSKDLSNFIEDNLHPNDKGFDEYAKNLIKELKELEI